MEVTSFANVKQKEILPPSYWDRVTLPRTVPKTRVTTDRIQAKKESRKEIFLRP